MDRFEEALKAAQAAQCELDRLFLGTDREAKVTLHIKQLSYAELVAKGRLDLCT